MDERLDLDAVRRRADMRAACLRNALAPGYSGEAALSYAPLTSVSADDVPALIAEIEHLGTALEAATNDVAALRADRDLLQKVIDTTDSLAEVERDQAIAERDRLAAQVARVREAIEDYHTVPTAYVLRALDGEP